MEIELYNGDILDIDADVLICSANVSLNLSGGVGGALMAKYGSHLQSELHSHLPTEPPRFAKQGDVVVTRPAVVPYKAVLHAVAVDPFYNSSVEIVSSVINQSLRLAAQEQAKSVALTALATGFGHLTIREFAEGLYLAIQDEFPTVDTLSLAVQSRSALAEIKEIFPDAIVRRER